MLGWENAMVDDDDDRREASLLFAAAVSPADGQTAGHFLIWGQNPKVSSTLCAARPQDRKTARPRCFIRFRCLRLVDRQLDTFLFSAKSKSVLRAVYRNSARPQDCAALLDTWKERDLPPAARVGRTARLIVVLCLVFFDLLEMAPPWPW